MALAISAAAMAAAALMLPASLSAQEEPAIISPEVSADRHVTFRFRDPNAKEVSVNVEGMAKPVPMQKDDHGVWSATIDPLEPDYYGYEFNADGVWLADPMNPLARPNLLGNGSQFQVPGPPQMWDFGTVPHGVVHHHFYHSQIIGDDRDYYVYTPPAYDAHAKAPYPVLYLLHGFSDDTSGWTSIGRANYILDNLIAQGKAKPMIVVMPLGYGVPEIVKHGFHAFDHAALILQNFERYRDALFAEVIPTIESTYHVSKDRKDRAIAGLSMGGAETLFIGLNALDRFSYIGAFSQGGLSEDYAKDFPSIDSSANDRLKVLWISCGHDDHLMEADEKVRDWLKSKDVKVQWTETPGRHQWQVWRRNLANFMPLLFQEK